MVGELSVIGNVFCPAYRIVLFEVDCARETKYCAIHRPAAVSVCPCAVTSLTITVPLSLVILSLVLLSLVLLSLVILSLVLLSLVLVSLVILSLDLLSLVILSLVISCYGQVDIKH